jgi:deoxyhypusine synthase
MVRRLLVPACPTAHCLHAGIAGTVNQGRGPRLHRSSRPRPKVSVWRGSRVSAQVCSEEVPIDAPVVKGYDFNSGVDYQSILAHMITTGYQATSFGQAIEEIRRMVCPEGALMSCTLHVLQLTWRLSDQAPVPEDGDDLQTPEQRAQIRCKIFFGYTSNLISSGIRESIRYLVEHNMVCISLSSMHSVTRVRWMCW